jgi:flagellar export protein FliJ
MKSFRFPLEAVLEARRAQETEARQQLSSALEKQREAAARSAEAARALDLLLQTSATASHGRFSVADRERSAGIRQAQERICAELRVAVQECVRLVEEKRAVTVEARRNRELLERLKSTRHDAWQKEAAQAEQHQFDEFAMTSRYQASQQAPVLC